MGQDSTIRRLRERRELALERRELARQRRELARQRRAERRPEGLEKARATELRRRSTEPEELPPPAGQKRRQRPPLLQEASKAARLANYLIDHVAIFLISTQLGLLLGPVAAGIVGLLGYYLFMEAVLGRTLGKFLTGTQVVTLAGEHPKLGAVLLRTLIRMVPFEPFSFLGEAGWHDLWSDTRVVQV